MWQGPIVSSKLKSDGNSEDYQRLCPELCNCHFLHERWSEITAAGKQTPRGAAVRAGTPGLVQMSPEECARILSWHINGFHIVVYT
ncbi:hypothetical protein PBY51_018545 [Eleginops maclovinus]|uniref:Uncharacterized protein n=1 Tax=Eleginops maclovinus TaxID=56733 RepID=A0AAN8AXH4_ELEMC|nr:hypothetical protein PBY51_018545 [Eleginops maclovinus]